VAIASTGRAYCMIQRAEADAADARGHTHSSRASCQQLTNMHIHCKGLGNTVDCVRSLNAVSMHAQDCSLFHWENRINKWPSLKATRIRN
jgi:hypothetical protein